MAPSVDVLVAGAGPAGGLAALELARRGMKVVVVERARYPRDKVCGDGLLEDSVACLARAGLDGLLRQQAHPIRYISFYSPSGESCTLEGEFYTLRRRQLDALIMAAACRRGAILYDGLRVVAPLRRDGVVSGALVQDARGKITEIQAPLVLLATGANAKVLEAFGMLRRTKASAIGVRGYFGAADAAADTMLVSFARELLPGYAWIFPLGGGIFNAGCGVFLHGGTSRAPVPGRDLLAFYRRISPLSQMLASAEPLGPVKGAPLRTGFEGASLAAPGVLVLGEAAGLTFAFIGEGVSCALESGLVAAEVAAMALETGDTSLAILGLYQQRLREALGARHLGYRSAQQWFSRPGVANYLIKKARRSEAVRALARDILTGKISAGQVFCLSGLLRVLLLR